MVKKDQENWFYIRQENGRVLRKFSLKTKGRESRGYKVNIYSLSPTLKLLTLSFYDGFVESREFYGTSSLYFLTFSPSNMSSSLRFSEGPYIWLEKQTRSSYVQAHYESKIEDLDLDGVAEFVLYRDSIKRIFRYVPEKGMVKLGGSL